MDGVWRVVLSPRWILWHVLAILAVAGCVLAAIWQWDRAGSALGSALNVGYGIQWPIFALFFAYMWWRFLRLELLEHRENTAEGPAPAEPGTVAAPPEPVRADTITEAPAGTGADVREGTSGDEAPAPWDASPFTRSPLATPAPVTDAEAPGLAEYNRMLAGLAARDAPHSAGRDRETADER